MKKQGEILYHNKYHVLSTRKPNWDYRTDGYYFVTICTYMRQPFFGEIKNGKMMLSDMGRICHKEWIKTTMIRDNVILDAFVIMPDHAHFLVVIDNGDDGQNNDERNGVFHGDGEYIHDVRKNVFRRDEAEPRLYTTGIPLNNEPPITRPRTTDISTNNGQTPSHPDTTNISPNIIPKNPVVSPTINDWLLIHNQNHPIPDVQRISPKPGSLSTIIGAYKSFCTRRIRELGYVNFMWQERYHDSIVRDEKCVFRVRQYIKNNPQQWHK